MPILASELKFYGSLNMPENDTATAGGGIDTACKIEFTDITPAGTVEMLSSATGDTTQTVTITGRNNAGEIISETKTLNGVTVVAFTSTFERILKVIMSATAAGTITIRKTSAGGDLVLMEPGITKVRRPFYNVSTPTTGSKDYYEKVFVRNTNATLSLTNAMIKEAADPSGKITFGVAGTLNDTTTTTNRITAPSGITFDNADKSVANNGNLSAGSSQGTWLKLTLASTDLATKTTYTLRCEGLST